MSGEDDMRLVVAELRAARAAYLRTIAEIDEVDPSGESEFGRSERAKCQAVVDLLKPEMLDRADQRELQAAVATIQRQEREMATDEDLDAIERDGDIARRFHSIAQRHNPQPGETVNNVMQRAIAAGDQEAIDLTKSMELDTSAAHLERGD